MPSQSELRRFRIRYRDLDPACPEFACTVRAYDREHAEIVFFDAPDGDGWKILSIRLIK